METTGGRLTGVKTGAGVEILYGKLIGSDNGAAVETVGRMIAAAENGVGTEAAGAKITGVREFNCVESGVGTETLKIVGAAAAGVVDSTDGDWPEPPVTSTMHMNAIKNSIF